MSWYEIVAIAVGMIFGGYLVLWSIPGVIMSAMVSLGDIERIVFIDKQLANNLNKYYDEKGYMRWDYQMSYAIGTRLFWYWLAYPFIKHRVTTTSKKFRVFMWVNCIGVWSFFIAPCFALLVQWLGNIG
ncbi:hypothetical protein NDJ00_11985 [Vibrio parahaemolyticus]|uniref:hypothetical protein n=1 Tax=Vibrio parahaemolyticus TaxID=670 RepID=UPI00215E2E9F|nr:hypothetical protein [Vibrio parahaemolyticus]MCS0114891.1 hypothetical protein [Vibrio parahaemolyticus]